MDKLNDNQLKEFERLKSKYPNLFEESDDIADIINTSIRNNIPDKEFPKFYNLYKEQKRDLMEFEDRLRRIEENTFYGINPPHPSNSIKYKKEYTAEQLKEKDEAVEHLKTLYPKLYECGIFNNIDLIIEFINSGKPYNNFIDFFTRRYYGTVNNNIFSGGIKKLKLEAYKVENCRISETQYLTGIVIRKDDETIIDSIKRKIGKGKLLCEETKEYFEYNKIPFNQVSLADLSIIDYIYNKINMGKQIHI